MLNMTASTSTSVNHENFFVLPIIFFDGVREHIAVPHVCTSPSLSTSQTQRHRGEKDAAPTPPLRQSQKQQRQSVKRVEIRLDHIAAAEFGALKWSAAVSFFHELPGCWLMADNEDGLFWCTTNMLERHFHGVYSLSYRCGCLCPRCSLLTGGLVLSSPLITLTRNEFGLDPYMWGQEITLAARFTLNPLECRHQYHSSKTMRTETWANEVNSRLQGGIRYLFSKDAVLLEGQTPFSYVSALSWQ